MRLVQTFLPARRSLAALVFSVFLGAGAFAAQVNFETLATGTLFGSGINTPGQVLFSQDGIDVSGVNFQTGSFEDFNLAQINGPGTDLFATKHVFFNNISFEFDLTGVAPINDVTIEYHEFGGVNNFAVNNGPILELPAMTDLPINVAPGVTATVDADSIHLSGTISNFRIGGQELAVDNIVAIPEPTCLALLVAGLGAGLLRRRR